MYCKVAHEQRGRDGSMLHAKTRPTARRVTAYDEAHHAFMTLPPYTWVREGEARQPGLCVKQCLQMI
jgi:hypothetical protein